MIAIKASKKTNTPQYPIGNDSLNDSISEGKDNSRNWHYWPPAILILLCLIVYYPVFTHQFQSFWDDQWMVLNRFTEGGLNRTNIWAILTEFYHGQYAPINQLAYTLVYSLFGYDQFWFHTLNLAVHAINALLLYYLLRKLLLKIKILKVNSPFLVAFITAVLFSIHPLQAESVAWISASKVVLYALFYLLAMHSYLQYLHNYQSRYFVLTILCFALSYGSKEQAVTLPICLL